MATTTLAEQIRGLREKTGAGMTDCKKALDEAGGDFDKAVESLRKKGLASAAKKSARTTSEGVIACYVAGDGKSAAIIELACETDFVAKTEEFQKAADGLAESVCNGEITESEQAEAKVKDLVAKLGENMKLARFERYALESAGKLGFYIHSAGRKKGALVELTAENDAAGSSSAADELLKELGMQIVAMSPRWTRRDEVPSDELDKEREIYSEAVRKEGKPEAAVPKIVEGKIEKLFFKAFCLLEMPSMRDNKTPMKDIIAEKSKEAGGSLSVKRFARFQLGGE